MNNDYENYDMIDNEEDDDDVIEYVYEKDRRAEAKRRNDWKSAIRRFKLLSNIRTRLSEHPLGYYRNNNEANASSTAASKKKTNTRKASASYKHKGGYGKATKYSPRDTKQIDSMNSDLVDE